MVQQSIVLKASSNAYVEEEVGCTACHLKLASFWFKLQAAREISNESQVTEMKKALRLIATNP